MAKRFDAVVVGAGHNGLTTAAYLAKAGRSVLVLDKRDRVGGSSTPVDIAPGVRGTAGIVHTVGRLRKSVIYSRPRARQAGARDRRARGACVRAPTGGSAASRCGRMRRARRRTCASAPRRTPRPIPRSTRRYGRSRRSCPTCTRLTPAGREGPVARRRAERREARERVPTTRQEPGARSLARCRWPSPTTSPRPSRATPSRPPSSRAACSTRSRRRGRPGARRITSPSRPATTAARPDSRPSRRGGPGALAEALATRPRGLRRRVPYRRRGRRDPGRAASRDRRRARRWLRDRRPRAVSAAIDPKRTLTTSSTRSRSGRTCAGGPPTSGRRVALEGRPRALGSAVFDGATPAPAGRIVIASVDRSPRARLRHARSTGGISDDPYLEATIPTLSDPSARARGART